MWMALEPVFTQPGGDIARQMPQYQSTLLLASPSCAAHCLLFVLPRDTRIFLKVDKEWATRLMNKARDVKNVLDCCQNEYIKNRESIFPCPVPVRLDVLTRLFVCRG